MTVASLALPVESALPFLRPALTAFGVAVFALRPLLGFGLVAAIVWLFQPLLRGVARAAYLLVHPRQSQSARTERRTLRSVMALHRMARELDTQQPSLAAELRSLANRG